MYYLVGQRLRKPVKASSVHNRKCVRFVVDDVVGRKRVKASHRQDVVVDAPSPAASRTRKER